MAPAAGSIGRVSSEPLAFAALDRGTATTAVSLVGRVDGRWRQLGSTPGPAGVPDGLLVERLRSRLAAADPGLAAALGLSDPAGIADLPNLAVATAPPPEIAVVAATERAARPLAAAAATAGWRVRSVIVDGADILAAATVLADPRLGAVLAGASDPPGADERPLIGELAGLVASATERRPDLITVLAGGLAEPGGRIEAMFRPDRTGPTIVAPSAAAGGGEALRTLLDGLRGGGEADGRRALAAGAAVLAEVLQRRVEVLEIGQSGACRVIAGWVPGGRTAVHTAIVPEAALLPRSFADPQLDAVLGWLPIPLDRLRVRDRLREMALAPWGDAAGEGAQLRLAALRAATERLLAATGALDVHPPSDLVIASGGAWSVVAPTAIALALADLVRRPGVRAVAFDHARLLAPLGTIADPVERAEVIRDLRDDLLVPLGTVLQPGDVRPGRSAGRMVVRSAAGSTELELLPGALELVDLPPGEVAVVELQLREPARFGLRTRHAAVEVAGGLAGLLVDLRGIPLELPGRLEQRREVLAAWQADLWPGADA
jgi:hypothetical protein